ncbi:MAG: response regulator [Bryobacteraceae bacterium]|nr:response regulator [Bryobacteraceae bacterium]
MSEPEKPRILVVEDERHIARFLQYVLEKAGFQVQIALDGKTAMDRIETFRPEGVVLDLVLPDIPGTEVLQAIRRSAACGNAAVVVLSAHTFEHGADGLDAGGRTVQCPKPIAPSRLLEKLRDFGLYART